MILYSLSIIYVFGVDYFGIGKLLVQFPAQLRLFLVGILLYLIFNKLNSKNIYVLVLLGIGLMISFSENKSFRFTFYVFYMGFLVMFLVYSLKYIKINFDFLYSFYILHFSVIQLSLYLGINLINPTISFVVLFTVILILSYFSEIYIEKICKKIIKKDKNDSN